MKATRRAWEEDAIEKKNPGQRKEREKTPKTTNIVNSI